MAQTKAEVVRGMVSDALKENNLLNEPSPLERIPNPRYFESRLCIVDWDGCDLQVIYNFYPDREDDGYWDYIDPKSIRFLADSTCPKMSEDISPWLSGHVEQKIYEKVEEKNRNGLWFNMRKYE